MQDLNDKVTGGVLSAAEWNQVPSEMQNIIEALGQVLSGSDLNQLGKSIAGYAGASTYYAESGVADAYVVNPIGLKQGPSSIGANHDGLMVRFVPGNNNTGASTINVNAIGVKSITREDGSPLQAGDLSTTRDAWIRWDFSSDAFVLQNFNIPGSLEVPRGFIDGIITSNAADTAHDITFGTGIARGAANSATIQLSSALTKQIDVAWNAGNNQGGFPSGLLTLTNQTWYHLFLIKDSVAGTVDAGFDTSLTAANLLAEAGGNYTLYRRVGAVYYDTTNEGGIKQYQQIGDVFDWNSSFQDVSTTNPGTGEVSHTITHIPTGLSVLADVCVVFGRPDSSGNTRYRVGPGDETLAAASTANNDGHTNGGGAYLTVSKLIRTSTARVIKTRQDGSNANATIEIQTHGWRDPRGKDA